MHIITNTNKTNNSSSKSNTKNQVPQPKKNNYGEKQPSKQQQVKRNKGKSRQLIIHQPQPGATHQQPDVEDPDIMEVVMAIDNAVISKTKHKNRRKSNAKKEVALALPEVTPELDVNRVTELVTKIDHQDKDLCVICHTDLTLEHVQLTHVKSCNHVFCYPCIKTWSTEYVPKCPLCKVPVTALCREGFEDEIIENNKNEQPKSPRGGPLDCLDHAYFLREIGILLSEAKRVLCGLERTNSSFNSNYKYNSRSKAAHQQRFSALKEAELTLTYMRGEMQSLGEIDPFFTLSQLYKIQEIIVHNSENREEERYDEDDYYNDDYDDDIELERRYGYYDN
ncbi:RING finger protein [Acrasis kona]|uniref:RING finger protein n=1 Tax=Acrasis kona TaxID=1008807 RepID=A0AAW2YZ11_9EUKA